MSGFMGSPRGWMSGFLVEGQCPTFGKRWVYLRQETLEKGGSASKHRDLSSQPRGLTNPARHSLAGSRKRVLRREG